MVIYHMDTLSYFTGGKAIIKITPLNVPDSTNPLSTASYTCFVSVWVTLDSESFPLNNTTASCRVCACNFSMMFRRCTFTVFSEMNEMVAISLLVKPCLTRSNIAFSRRVKAEMPAKLILSLYPCNELSIASILADIWEIQ